MQALAAERLLALGAMVDPRFASPDGLTRILRASTYAPLSLGRAVSLNAHDLGITGHEGALRSALGTLALDLLCQARTDFDDDALATAASLAGCSVTVLKQLGLVLPWRPRGRHAFASLRATALQSHQFQFTRKVPQLQACLAADALMARPDAPALIERHWDDPVFQVVWPHFFRAASVANLAEAIDIAAGAADPLDHHLQRPRLFALQAMGHTTAPFETLGKMWSETEAWVLDAVARGGRMAANALEGLAAWQRPPSDVLRQAALAALENADERVRTGAVAALASSNDDPGVRRRMVDSLAEDDLSMRCAIAAALFGWGYDPEVRDALVDLLSIRMSPLSENCHAALWPWWNHPDLRPIVFEEEELDFDEGRLEVICDLIWQTRRLGQPDLRSMVCQWLANDDPFCRRIAANLLGQDAWDNTIASLLEPIARGDVETEEPTRASAIEGLGDAGRLGEHIDVLAECAQSTTSIVSDAALKSVQRWAPYPAAVPALLAQLKSAARRPGMHGFDAIASLGLHPGRADVVHALTSAAFGSEQDDLIRKYAIAGLGGHTDDIDVRRRLVDLVSAAKPDTSALAALLGSSYQRAWDEVFGFSETASRGRLEEPWRKALLDQLVRHSDPALRAKTVLACEPLLESDDALRAIAIELFESTSSYTREALAEALWGHPGVRADRAVLVDAVVAGSIELKTATPWLHESLADPRIREMILARMDLEAPRAWAAAAFAIGEPDPRFVQRLLPGLDGSDSTRQALTERALRMTLMVKKFGLRHPFDGDWLRPSVGENKVL